MSIAVSAVVRPSRILKYFLVCASLVLCAIACIIGFGLVGERSLESQVFVLSGIFFAEMYLIYTFSRYKKTLRIDISGIGQIRITHYSELDRSIKNPFSAGVENGVLVELMDGSTLWPGLMLLHLKAADSRIFVVPVLPGSVTRAEFRSLSVALRWIAVHRNKAINKNEGGFLT